MTSVSPVVPGSEICEIVLGENQPEYIPLPALYLDTPERPMITRWRFSDEERDLIAGGADLVFQQLTFGHPYQPVMFEICMPKQTPDLGSI